MTFEHSLGELILIWSSRAGILKAKQKRTAEEESALIYAEQRERELEQTRQQRNRLRNF